jgi:hypothetical protein
MKIFELDITPERFLRNHFISRFAGIGRMILREVDDLRDADMRRVAPGVWCNLNDRLSLLGFSDDYPDFEFIKIDGYKKDYLTILHDNLFR